MDDLQKFSDKDLIWELRRKGHVVIVKENLEECMDCDDSVPSEYIRHTQFAGKHPFCSEHAHKEPDFSEEDDDSTYWEKRTTEGTWVRVDVQQRIAEGGVR